MAQKMTAYLTNIHIGSTTFCDTSKFSNLIGIAQLTAANGLSTVDNFLG